MKIIISGGSGLIGRRLTLHLVLHGSEVVVLSRNPEGVIGLPQGARAVRWDGKTGEGWDTEVEGAAAIVNLAGENLAGENFFPTRWTASRRKLILESRLDAGKAVVDAVRRTTNKPGVVVQASAVGFYGPQRDEPITETAPPGSDFLARVCVEWEGSTAAVEEMGVRHVAIRTGIYLSAEGGALPRLLLQYKLFAGGPFGNGKQWYAWIHPADHAAAILFLIENEAAEGAYNLAAPNPLPNKDFGKALGRVLRRPSLIPVPGFAMKLLFGEVSTVVVDGQRVLPARLEAAGFQFMFPELEKALREILAP